MKVIFLDVDGVLNSNAYVDYTLKNNVKGLRIGVPKEYFGDGINPEVREAIEKAIDSMKYFSSACEIACKDEYITWEDDYKAWKENQALLKKYIPTTIKPFPQTIKVPP